MDQSGHGMSVVQRKMSPVVDSSRRMLELLSLLQLQREWSGAELADRLGVSDRTLRRDVDKLRELDYPVHAVAGRGGGYRLGDGARLPPLQLLSDEAVAAAIALTTAASSNVHGVGEAAQRARRGDSRPPRPGVPARGPEELLPGPGARQDRARWRFACVRGDGPGSRREAEPYGLVAWTGRWYLVAWDVEREDWRTFRIDRLRPRIPLGKRFAPRPLPDGNAGLRSEEHTSELQSRGHLVCRLLLAKKKKELQK